MSFFLFSSSLRFFDFSLFQTVYAEERDNVTESNTLNDSGIIKGRNNNHLDAILDFDKAILLNPKNVNAYLNRANAKNILMDYHLQKLVKTNRCLESKRVDDFFQYKF